MVDNNSTDNTTEFAQNVHAKSGTDIAFKVVQEPQPGLMNARKCGIQTCKYEMMLFVDDDNWLNPNYVDLCFDLMQNHPNTGILGGFGTPANQNLPAWFEEYSGSFAVGQQGSENGKVSCLYGAGMCIRKKAWLKLESHGFKSILLGRTGKSLTSGEDTEICYAIQLAGFEISYNDRLRFKHDLPDARLNWKHLRQLYYGFGMAKAQLDIYSGYLKGNPIPKDGKLPFWFNRAVYLFQQLIPEIPLLIASSVLRLEGNGNILTALAKVGQIKGVLNTRKNYLERYKQVYQLAKKLKGDEEKK